MEKSELLSKEKLESWYTPKEGLTEKEELVAEGDNERCPSCKRVDCMCYEESIEN